ncbi:MAG: ABC transporter ATP-binding protein [Nitrosomonadales bacterium]|nr:ABC transporter ATP-binding protein [Nitrosomonadales bacterium]
MSTVISVENLSKKYVIDHQKQGRHTSLRDALTEGAKHLTDKFLHPFSATENGPSHEDFWALKDVSFDIQQGDRVGIIGRNGAGKSTLLKILSRITEPTSGRVSIKGRVASLLEVGTGFHPELTGRENIFLNGAILGMSKAEIRKRFDEIVAFAEVERFLDTPVKRYSSGMYVRLAFAVAAHLEPEILIVDEVLAVGDAQFQKKCLGKMQDVSAQERTILFVSHSMAAISNLCTKAIYLDSGRVRSIGNTEAAISAYLKLGAESAQTDLRNRKDRTGNGLIRFLSFELRSCDTNEPLNSVTSGSSCILAIKFERGAAHEETMDLNVAVGIDDRLGNRITHLSNVTTNQSIQSQNNNKEGIIEIEIKEMPLSKGSYGVTLFSTVAGDIADWVKNAGSFHVEEGDFFHTGKVPHEGQGVFYIKHSFRE